ncbi:MAG: protein kinase [Clostridiales bacterium]|nr:protein kinase [Clostridiales bacterium]
MELKNELALSYYQPIATGSFRNSFELVQHVESKALFARKRLTSCPIDVLRALQKQPVANMPRICELIEENNTLILIEEYLAGHSLQELLEKEGLFSEEKAISCTLQLCAIIRELHHRYPAIIHCDITPSNVILSPDHVIKLVNYGKARFFRNDPAANIAAVKPVTDDSAYPAAKRIADNPAYPAAEAIMDNFAHPATDIQAIGVLLNVLLTGKLPSEEIGKGLLAGIIAGCTGRDPSNRYETIDALTTALQCQAVSFQTMGMQQQKNPTRPRRLRPAIAGKFSSQPCAYKEQAPEKPSWRRFLPPGFRSGTLTNILLAAAVYAFLLFTVCMEAIYQADDPLIFGGVLCAFLADIFFTADYLGIQSFFPLTKSQNKTVRVLGILLYDILILTAAIVIICVLDAFL